ncbi:MAG TPA: ParB N-terminal domain-containing protein [Gemmatimonadales bacterium]
MPYRLTSDTLERLRGNEDAERRRDQRLEGVFRSARTGYLGTGGTFGPRPPGADTAANINYALNLRRTVEELTRRRQVTERAPSEEELGAQQFAPGELRRRSLMNSLRARPPTETNRNEPGYREDPRITELRSLEPDLGSADPLAIAKGFAEGLVINPLRGLTDPLLDAGGAALEGDIGGVAGAVGRAGRNLITGPSGPLDQLAGRGRVVAAVEGKDPRLLSPVGFDSSSQINPLTPISGRIAIDNALGLWTDGQASLKDFGLGEDTSPRLVNELIEALAPINFFIAGQGTGLAAAIRAAGVGRSRVARVTLNQIAGAVEPFAGRGGSALGREVAADVVAQEAFARTEGLPGGVRFGAAVAAGTLTGFSPEISASTLRFGVRAGQEAPQLLVDAALRYRDLTRNVPIGLGVRDIGDDALEGARRSLFDAYRSERTIERLGTARRELREGRAGQARGVQRQLDEAIGGGPVGPGITDSPAVSGYPELRLDDSVDGRRITGGGTVENTGSIEATFTEYEVLPGLREIPVADFPGAAPRDMFYSKSDLDQVRELTAAIRESGEISPLIIAVDAEGPYVLEGAHRLAALHELGAKSFPALVVEEPDALYPALAARQSAALQEEAVGPAEEAVRRARAGARVEGTIRQTFAEPVDLGAGEREAIFGEVARMLSDGDIDSFQFLQLGTAIDRLIKGEGLRPFEVESRPLRTLLGDEIVDEIAKRPARQTLAAADARIRRETDRFIAEAQRAEDRALATQARADQAALDARIAALEQPVDPSTPIGVRASFIDVPRRGRELREFADLDRRLRAETERFSEQATRRQNNARNASEAKAFNAQRRLREALDETVPNAEQLKRGAQTILDRPQPDTPQGARVVGESGKPTGVREPTPVPNVPVELAAAVRETIDAWLDASEAVLANMSTNGHVILRTIDAQINGTLESPFLTELVYQGMNLQNALVNQFGVEDRVARQIADRLMDNRLAERFGDGFTAVRRQRYRVKRQIKGEFRRAGEDPLDDAALDLAVDERLRARFTEQHGAAAVANERMIDRQLRLLNQPANFQGLRAAVQRTKNTMFGLDAAIFGIQANTAIFRGGVALLAKSANDILASLHLPHARLAYSESFLPRQIQYAIDGVDQTGKSSAMRPDEGSLISWIPGVGDLYTRVTSWLNDVQFGTVLTAVRNASYEGDLVMMHVLHQLTGNASFDVSDPLVRSRAARHANHVGSAARPALRSQRAEAEAVLFTSARMTRARFANINEMAKLLTANNATDRALAAITITSAVSTTLILGQYLNNLFGVGDYEWDPRKGGFGTITTSGGRVIDLIPQDPVVRAFARSIDEIRLGDPVAAGQAWAKVFLGSASIVGRIPPALAGVGFEPGAGFRFGDLTKTGTLLQFAPLPPVVMNGIVEGWDAMGAALDTVGLANYQEASFAERARVLEEAGIETEGRSNTQENADIAETLGQEELERLETRRVEELRELAGRGHRRSLALLLSVELREELTRIADESQTKAEYRFRRKNAIQQYIGAQAEYEDIFRGFAESTDPILKLAGQRYALRDEAVVGSELDFDLLEELQGQFDAALSPTQREQVREVINAVDVREHPWEQEYDLLSQELGEAGWWDLREDTWSADGFAKGTGYATYEQFRDEITREIEAQLVAAGLPAGRAYEQAGEEFAKIDITGYFNEAVRMRRLEWVAESRHRIELADQMLEWGLWNAPKDVEDLIDATLYERRPGAREPATP